MNQEGLQNQYIDIDSGEVFNSAERALEAQNEKRQVDLEEKNPPFVQLTKGVGLVTLAKLTEKSPTSISVLMFFFENMDNYNTIMVSQKIIAETIDKSRQAVGNAIKVLEEERVIGVGKVGQANVYLINPKLAWQNGYKKRRTMNLKGNILLGQSENEELFKQFENIETKTTFKRDNLSTKISK